MNASNTPDAFLTTRLCRGLDPGAAAQLFALATPVSFLAGTRIVRQGEPSRGAFVIRDGDVEARVSLPGGGERAVARLSDGQVFGEMALIEHGAASASVFAVTHVDGWFIEREPFRALTAGRNAAALAIQRTITASLVERLGALNAELMRQEAHEDRPAARVPEGDPLAGVARGRRASFEHARFLPLLSFFAGFTPEEIDAATAAASILELPRGHWVFTPGSEARACYLVVRGAVEAVAVREGRERRMALLGPGTLAGYLSVLRGTRHGAGARVREAVTLIEMPAAHFTAMYGGTAGYEVKVQHAIHKALLQSLARSNSQLSRLVTQQALPGAVRARAVAAAL